MARQRLTVDQYVDGVLKGDRTVLARTITLIESNAAKHMETAQEVLRQLLPESGKAIRVGVTGVPGAGKSTFIEAFGNFLCGSGHKVAVLAVDPSSSITRGSILADKTRMETLSQQENAFIRPSPSSGTLGGVARKTRETLLVCEAAGFDVMIVETVGVGQSETLVSTMVDFFLLLSLTGAGDELQNIKKGVIELSDAILINKADGENKIAAARMKADLNQALHYLSHSLDGWTTRAYCGSAMMGEGISEIWKVINNFISMAKSNGYFESKRRQQSLEWLNEVLVNQITASFFQSPGVTESLPKIKQDVTEGKQTVTAAASDLLRQFYQQRVSAIK